MPKVSCRGECNLTLNLQFPKPVFPPKTIIPPNLSFRIPLLLNFTGKVVFMFSLWVIDTRQNVIDSGIGRLMAKMLGLNSFNVLFTHRNYGRGRQLSTVGVLLRRVVSHFREKHYSGPISFNVAGKIRFKTPSTISF